MGHKDVLPHGGDESVASDGTRLSFNASAPEKRVIQMRAFLDLTLNDIDEGRRDAIWETRFKRLGDLTLEEYLSEADAGADEYVFARTIINDIKDGIRAMPEGPKL